MFQDIGTDPKNDLKSFFVVVLYCLCLFGFGSISSLGDNVSQRINVYLNNFTRVADAIDLPFKKFLRCFLIS